MTDSQTPGRSNGDEFDDLEVLGEQFADETGEYEPLLGEEDLASVEECPEACDDEAKSAPAADSSPPDTATDEPGASAAASWSLTGDFGHDEMPAAVEGDPFWLEESDTADDSLSDDVEVLRVERAHETGMISEPPTAPIPATEQTEQPEPAESKSADPEHGTSQPELAERELEISTNAIEVVHVQYPQSVPEPPRSPSVEAALEAIQRSPAYPDSPTWSQLETGEVRIDPAALAQARAQFESMQQHVTAEHGRLGASAPDEGAAERAPAQPYPRQQIEAVPERAAIEASAQSAPADERPVQQRDDRHAILHPAEPDTDDELAQAAITRVRSWIECTDPRIHRDPAAQRLSTLLQDEAGLRFAIRFIDRVARTEDRATAAREFDRLSRHVPDFLDWYLKFAISIGGGLGVLAPGVVIPLAKRTLRRLARQLVIDATPERLGKRLQKLAADGTRLNVTLIGESVLGEQGAQHRLDGTLQLLARPDVDCISVELSSFVPKVHLWAFDETVEHLVQRVMPLYRLAASTPQPKLITLDVSGYDDLDVTMEVFQRVLSDPELHGLEAGIVLQTYHPDALGALEKLTDWARKRVAAGGAGIRVRLVKGANLAIERVESAIRGWPLTTVADKSAADANFKRVLRFALQPETSAAVRVGVASHNLFDIAYAVELAQRAGTLDRVGIETLLGMGSQHVDAIRADVPQVMLYTPVVHPRDFDAAVVYLVRRLEENAGDENFLHRAAAISDDLEAFELERDRFLASLALMADEDAVAAPVRTRRQNRGGGLDVAIEDPAAHDGFFNEPDTDPTLAENREWASRVLARTEASEVGEGTLSRNLVDDIPTMERRIRRIVEAAPSWRDRGADERRRVLYDAGVTLGAYRGRLIEAMASETGKPFAEADAEVSEAIDLCRHYGDGAIELEQLEHASPVPVDLTVVVSPSNFPVACPAGGIAAALATGSTVIVKPSRQGRRSAAVLVEALWEAGVPRDVLVFCAVEEREVSQHLIAHEAVGRIILTGSTETAALFTTWRPGLPIIAETSGKNAIVVTPAADFDLAVRDLVHSAFGHAGQKSSAASLGILVGQVARSERFRTLLVDAVQSLRVAMPTDPAAQVGPLVEPAHGKLERALTTLEEGETWLVEPRRLDDEGRLWSPGVRIGVQPGSFTHLTEFFGPHLSLIEVPTLADAVAVQNGTDFGLTAGIHSLDAAQVAEWLDRVEAGNLYVNRRITGAVVRRQPYGGWKLSQVGPGAKAGGSHYLGALVDWRPIFERPRDNVRLVGLAKHVATVIEAATPQLDFLEFDRVRAGANSDQRAWEAEFGLSRDISKLVVERNVLRYRPSDEVLVRLPESGTIGQLMRVLAAAARAGARIRISSARELPPHLVAVVQLDDPPLAVEQIVIETDAEFHGRVISGAALAPVTSTDAAGTERAGSPVRRIRLAGADETLAGALAGNIRVALYDGPVSTEGRLELLPFLREQSVSVTAHRYGTPDEDFLRLPL